MTAWARLRVLYLSWGWEARPYGSAPAGPIASPLQAIARSCCAAGCASHAMRMHITLNVNAKQHGVEPEPSVSLLDLRREHLDLTGSKDWATRARGAAIASSPLALEHFMAKRAAHAARSGSRTPSTAPRSHTPAQLFREAATSPVAA